MPFRRARSAEQPFCSSRPPSGPLKSLFFGNKLVTFLVEAVEGLEAVEQLELLELLSNPRNEH